MTTQETRAFGRLKARELTPAEIDAVAGAYSQVITCPCEFKFTVDGELKEVSGGDDGSD